MAAMEQPTLGQYFTTRKKGLEGVHPAKRRKVDVTDTESEATVRRSTRARRQVASSQTKTSRTHKGVTCKSRAKESLNEESVESSYKVGHKIVSEPTSLFDDHAFAEALIGKLSDAQRKRKMVSSSQTEDTIVNVSKDTSVTEIISVKAQKDNDEMESRAKNRRRTARSSKHPKQTAKSDKKTADHDQVRSVSSELKAKSSNDQSPREVEVPTGAQASPSKTPPVVRRIGGGVKANPWIAEQAKIVLSRGRAAVNLSQQAKSKGKEGQQVNTMRDSNSGESTN